MTDETALQRATLRKLALQRRDDLPPQLAQAHTERICATLLPWLTEKRARFVHSYISFRSEVGTRHLIPKLIAEGIRVVVPVVNPDRTSNEMTHVEVDGLEDLVASRFGLHEPSSRREADLDQVSVILVPLAAFDRTGARLGYGKGFYDRFLSEHKALRVGLAYSIQEFDRIPTAPHDERLDYIVTEREIIQCISKEDKQS